MKHKINQAEKLYGMGQLSVVKDATSRKENGVFEFIASGIKVDRYGEVVDPAGWDFKAYKENPVMLWAHDSKIPAIARVVKIWKDEKQVYAQAEWAPTPFAQELRQLVEAGFINAVSVGFLPREWEGEWPSYKYIDQELLEISVVNVPAYADALIDHAKEMGLALAQKAFEGIKTTEPEEKGKPGEDKGKEKAVEAVEQNEDGITLHFSDMSRKHFALSETALAERKNVIQFSADEFEAFKKEMSEPLSPALKKQLASLSDSLTGMSEALTAFVASSAPAQGREGEVKTEKAPLVVDIKEWTKVASKATEVVLLGMRRGNSDKQ